MEITPSNVPFPQCREIRTEGVGESKRLDNIIIPASTAIVVCVIVAVIIFIACLKVAYLFYRTKKYVFLFRTKKDIFFSQSSNKKNRALADEKPIHTLSMSMNGLNLAGMGPPAHPGAPLAGLASLGLAPPGQKDWDNMSVYRWGVPNS